MSMQPHIMTEMVRRRRDRTRKRAREPQEMITADNWTSIAWTNGNKRVIGPGEYDPYDNRAHLLRVADRPPSAAIDGAGICVMAGSSPRFYIDGQWQNIEMSSDIFIGKSVKECYLVVRSNHEDRPDGFGGYYLYLNYDDQEMYFKKELTHELGYSSRLVSKSIRFQRRRWVNAKIRVKNGTAGEVEIQGEFNEQNITLTDSGQIKCGDVSNTAPYLDVGKWCFIRTNSPSDVRYRNVSIMQI
jgi:hypothetical protein